MVWQPLDKLYQSVAFLWNCMCVVYLMQGFNQSNTYIPLWFFFGTVCGHKGLQSKQCIYIHHVVFLSNCMVRCSTSCRASSIEEALRTEAFPSIVLIEALHAVQRKTTDAWIQSKYIQFIYSFHACALSRYCKR